MQKQATFGNTALAQKMASRFSAERETVKVRMRYSGEVRKFISKIEKAHKKAAKSKLSFG